MMLRLPMDRSDALAKVRIPVPRAMKTDYLAGDQGRVRDNERRGVRGYRIRR